MKHAAAAAGQTVEEFARDAIIDAAEDPFVAALERAVDTVAARDAEDRIRHSCAN
ncbi:hypothetical protein [Streptomyces sp. NPDC058739]|uniref:hypothetical protein n=1 Tax=Streptomyces sp. NPDC058739 TaxID=3346618 RepID=UPI0036B11C53